MPDLTLKKAYTSVLLGAHFLPLVTYTCTFYNSMT